MESPLSLFLLNDEPIRELVDDGLDLKAWARVVAGIAVDTDGPFTIGLYGRWGVGKTSILHLAQNIIHTESEKVKAGQLTTIFFNAWRYENEENLLIPLLASIIQAMKGYQGIDTKFNKHFTNLKNALLSVLMSVSGTFSGSIPAGTPLDVLSSPKLSAKFDPAKIRDYYKELSQEWIDEQVASSLHHNTFEVLEKLQETAQKDGLHRIVVFIDDLDRCLPTKALHLLEQIKLILNQRGFIFVLAVDDAVIQGFLKKRYKEEFGIEDYAYGPSYLDKIIQLPLWIPPHKVRFDGLVEKLLDHRILEGKKEKFHKLSNILGFCSTYNPRKLIRFLNDLLVDERLWELIRNKKNATFPLDGFAVARGMRHQNAAIYNFLRREGNDAYRKLLLNKKEGSVDNKEGDTETRANSLRKKLRSLCNGLQAGLPAELALDEESLTMSSVLVEHQTLLFLICTDQGQDWLENDELRKEVHNFIVTVHDDDVIVQDGNIARDDWKQQQIRKALRNLVADEASLVAAACHLLISYGDHTVIPVLDAVIHKWQDKDLELLQLLSRTRNHLISSARGEI